MYVVGIVVILFVLFKFGIPALTNLSLFLSSKNASNQSANDNSSAIIAAPVLNQPFTATNSATITVSGNAGANQTVELFVNSSQVDSKPTNSDGSFSFTGVALSQQQNTIQAKAEVNNKTSDFSDTWNVSYLQKTPSLTVDNPHDGDTLDNSHSTVVVSGKTDPDIQVTVNGFWAIVANDGSYSYTLSLQNGDNHIEVVATDAAGNTTKQDLTIHHSQ